MNFRQAVFWMHLVAGLVIGAVVLTMSITGLLLAYERQIYAFAERPMTNVAPPVPGQPPLTVEALAEKARVVFPEAKSSGFTLKRDPAVAMINYGRERTVFLDPYTGAVLGEGTKLRGFLHEVEHLHRDLLIGQNGKKITGACSLAFLGLIVTGLYLWFPRKWTKAAFGAISVPSLKLRGKARDWNWHNAVGLWAALPLIVAILTGAIMSYPWANNLLFRATGNEPPPPRNAAAPRAQTAPPEFRIAGLDALWARAVAQVPGWKSIALRLPESPGAPLTFFIDEGDGATPHTRSQLALHPKTGEVQRWEPYSSYNLGRQLRMWVRPVHTGEALGLFGQTVAALAALGAATLVWTGFALAWRRFRNRARRGAPASVPGIVPEAVETTTAN